MDAVYKRAQGEVKMVGSPYQPWEISVDGYIGSSPKKNVARMIAVVRRYLDATFDGSAPLPEDVVARMERPSHRVPVPPVWGR